MTPGSKGGQEPWKPEGSSNLYVRVGVFGGAFHIKVSFKKRLRDDVSEKNGIAETWDTGSLGTHGGNGGFILQGVSEHLDRFVLEYLRVNETVCR